MRKCKHDSLLEICNIDTLGKKTITNYICESCDGILDVCLDNQNSICSDDCNCRQRRSMHKLAPWQLELGKLKINEQ